MYNLANCVPFTGQVLRPEQVVLVWSRSTGYFFTTYHAVADSQAVVAVSL